MLFPFFFGARFFFVFVFLFCFCFVLFCFVLFSMILLGLLLLVLPWADGLTWVQPAFGPFAPFAGVTTPTYEWSTMWQAENPSVWGKNYSLVPSPDGFGCAPPPPGYAVGRLVTALGPPNNMCVPSEMAQAAKQGGAVGVLITTPFPQVFGMFHTAGPSPWSWGQGNLPPVVTWGNLNPQLPVAQQVPLSLVAYNVFQAQLNMTVNLNYPSQNPLFSEYYQIPSQMSALVWIGFTWAMISVTYVVGKLFVDIQFSGFRLALPLVVLSFCYAGSIIIVLFSLTAFAGVFSAANLDATGYMILFPYTCTTSACVLVGFYFTETAHLTSQTSIALLDRLKIPGYISIGVIWVVYFVVSAIGTFYRSGNPQDQGSVGPGYAIAVTYGLLALFAMFIALFGGISLIRALPDTANIRRSIVLTVGLVVVSSFVNLVFLPLVITLRWWVFDAFANILQERQIVLLFGVCWVWPPAWIYIMLASVFRVSLSKEIEISKSATSASSTSSTKSNSSTLSAYSTSSSADPVIEL